MALICADTVWLKLAIPRASSSRASRAQVARRQRAEFLAMGLVAGVLATVGALLIGEVLARRVFEIDLPPNLALWLAGPLAGLLLLSFNAWLSARKVLAAPPALTLRDSV